MCATWTSEYIPTYLCVDMCVQVCIHICIQCMQRPAISIGLLQAKHGLCVESKPCKVSEPRQPACEDSLARDPLSPLSSVEITGRLSCLVLTWVLGTRLLTSFPFTPLPSGNHFLVPTFCSSVGASVRAGSLVFHRFCKSKFRSCTQLALPTHSILRTRSPFPTPDGSHFGGISHVAPVCCHLYRANS